MPAGSLDTQVLHACRDDAAFRATRSPYLLVDGDLRVVGANPAWHEAASHVDDGLAGRLLSAVFVSRPDDPGAVHPVTASIERVLRLGLREDLTVLRYTVAAPDGIPPAERDVIAVHSPLRTADGRVIGVLHHAEDVTGMLDPGTDDAGPAAATLIRTLRTENAQLRDRFARHVTIEQAKGALMARRGCSADEAFGLLRTLSHETNTKLHVVAETLLADAAGPPG
jgi:response regulator NasT